MTSLSTKANRLYPSLPNIDESLDSHTAALQAMKDAVQTHERQDGNYLKSFVRFEELIDLGIINEDGVFILNVDIETGESAVNLTDLNDVTITSPADNAILGYDTVTAEWIDQTAAQLGLSVVGHTHPPSSTTIAFDDLTDVELTGAHDYDLLFRDDDGDWKPTQQLLQWDGADLHMPFSDLRFYAVGDSVSSAIRQNFPIAGDLMVQVTAGNIFLQPGVDVVLDGTTNLIVESGQAIRWFDEADDKQTMLKFAPEAGGSGGEVAHAVAKSFSSQQTTSGTYIDKTAATIAHASLEDNEDYLVYVRATHFNLTSQSTAANGIRLTYNDVVLNGAEKLWEGVIGAADERGQQYSWCGIVSSGTVGDIQLEFKSGNGSDAIDVGACTILAIKVSDLTLSTNIFHDEDLAVIELDDGNFPPTNYETLGASLTIGDGTSDYLVFGCVWIGDWLTGGNIADWRVRESLGNTVKDAGAYGRADNSDETPQAFIELYQAQAATTLTIEATCTGNPVDAKRSFLAAIRLNAFAEYFIDYDADPDESGWGYPTNQDIVTLAETASVTSTNWGFIAACTDTWAGSGVGEDAIINLDIDGAGDINVAGPAWHLQTNSTSRRETRFMMSADQTINSGQTIDADLQYSTPTSANSAGVTEALIVGFTWELSSAPEFFNVGHPAYTTRMKGLTTRFYDPGFTDYVQFDHDDVDFNITGFQTADINITDITSIQAGTVDVDFDDITATTYGGILEANLLSRIADEAVSGNWTWTGRLVTDDSTTTRAGFNIPTGVEPTSPVQGDIWVEAADIFARLNGVTTPLTLGREFFIGASLDDPDVSVSSNGTVITFTLEEDGGGDIRFLFSDGIHTHDCTPIASIALTAGTDISPTLNYVYILQSTKALTVSTSSWPAAEHAPLATVLCQSAASIQTDGVYKMHAWTDHSKDDEGGHIAHINFWVRNQPATWRSGTLCTPTVGAATFDLAVASGSILQLHLHALPAFDTSTGSEVMIVNQNATAYDRVGNMVSQLTDAAGGSMSGKYYNLVIWGVVSEDSADCQIMVNLPTASYNTSTAAILDADATTVYDIPTDFIGTGFLIARLVCRHQVSGNTYSISSNIDLRGKVPSTSAGGTVGGGVTSLGDLSDADPTGFANNDLMYWSGGVLIDTAAALTWDGSALATTGIISLPAGTEGLPSLVFTGDLDTGIWSPGANIFAISVGGTEAVRYTGSSAPLIDYAMPAGITASTTQTQGQEPLTASYNRIVTVTNNDDVVTLPPARVGRFCLVINAGANRLQLFPASGCDLGEGTNIPTSIKKNTSLLFMGTSTTEWHDIATKLDSLQGVDLTGAADGDLLVRTSGIWEDTGGLLTWDSTLLDITGDLQISGDVGFYGTAAVAQQTGVAVTAAGIHAALVNLGLITA